MVVINTRKNKSLSIYKLIVLICLFTALGVLGFRVYAFFNENNRYINDPVNTAIPSEGEEITDTVILGSVKIPFTDVFEDDTTGDGYTDRRSYYQNDMLVLAAWDTNSDGTRDLWFHFTDGDYVDLEAYDLTGNGQIDKLVSVDENESVTDINLFHENNLNMSAALRTLILPVISVIILTALLARKRR